VLVSACGSSSSNSSSSPSSSNAASTTLKAGVTLDLPPYQSVANDGKPVGFEIDLINKLGGALGMKVQYVKSTLDQFTLALNSGRFELGASGLFIRCARIAGSGKFGAFTVPFFAVGQSIATTKAHAGTYTSLASLHGKAVGTEGQVGAGTKLVQSVAKKYGLSSQVYANVDDMLLALAQGRVDAAVESTDALAASTRNKPDLVVSGNIPNTTIPVGLLLKPGDPVLTKVNSLLNTMKTDGSLKTLYSKWFGGALPPGSPIVTIVPSVTTKTCKN
jgi:polar amino acid transport system substrate-binding protein